MAKMVVILDRGSDQSAADIVPQIQKVPGLSVTATSKSFIDVEVDEETAGRRLMEFAKSKGLDVQPVSQPELIEPISPFKFRK